ncbi:NADH-quinone oxidoreductase subunit N [Nitratifractor sp.]
MPYDQQLFHSLPRRASLAAALGPGGALKAAALILLALAGLFSSSAIGLEGFAVSQAGGLFTVVLMVVLFAVALHSENELTITQLLVLGAASAALLQSHSLLAFLVAFEGVSLVSVVLVSQIRTPEQAEGAVKIFIAGAIATGILMFGAFLYTLDGGKLLEPLKVTGYGYYGTAGIFLMLLGVFYKLTIVPMHGWAVDTYSLVRADHAALLSGAAKTAAALGAFLLFAPALKVAPLYNLWILVPLALVTMTLGNFMALAQKNLARILAWSSVAHAGYMLIGFAAVSSERAEAGMLYMVVAYLFMQSAVFLLLDHLRREGIETLEELAGLGRRYPLLGLFFTVQLFSLAGIPLLAGFLGKAVLFYAGVEAGLWGAVLVALLNSALSVAYYAWIVKQLWFESREEEGEISPSRPTALGAQTILLAGTLWFGLFAGSIFAAAG